MSHRPSLLVLPEGSANKGFDLGLAPSNCEVVTRFKGGVAVFGLRPKDQQTVVQLLIEAGVDFEIVAC